MYAVQLPVSSTDDLKMYRFLAEFGRDGRVFGAETASSVCVLSIEATKGLHNSTSDGSLFKALTSVWLKELRPLNT